MKGITKIKKFRIIMGILTLAVAVATVIACSKDKETKAIQNSDSTDYWDEYYVEYSDGTFDAGGKCGPYVGQGLNSGAPKELTEKLPLVLPVYSCNGVVYFTDYTNNYRISFDDFIDPFFLYDENSPCGYKLFFNSRDPYDVSECIDPAGMNYYLSKGPELIDHFAPCEKVVVSAKYLWGQYLSVDETRNGPSFHYIEANYAVLHCRPYDM